MVGVAGKSQACRTCRQKRLRCDMRRPFCRKCAKAKRTCAGYDRDLIFVNRTPSSWSITAVSVLAERRALQQPNYASTTSAPTVAELTLLFSESENDCCAFRKYAIKVLEATYLPKQPISTTEGSFSWAYCIPELVKPSKSLDTSVYAFCLSQLHVTGLGSASFYECLDQYNIALRHLYTDLDNTERRSQEETLAAIIVLSTCELFVYPAATSWGVHARGITEILRLSDLKMSNPPAWQHLFSRMRIVCVLEALTKREAQILKNDMWRHAMAGSNISTPVDEIFQMATEVPVLLEQAATLCSIEDRDALVVESAAVIRSMFDIVKSFEAWYNDFWKTSSTPRARLVPSTATNPADIDGSDKVFPFCFEFQSIVVAVPIIMCWGVATQLYSNVIQIYDLVQARQGREISLWSLLAQADTAAVVETSTLESSSPTIPLLTAGKSGSMQDIKDEGTRLARHICQCLEYFHRIEMGIYGCHAMTYQFWSARQYFRLHPGHEREISWLNNMDKMEGPGTRWGLSLMMFADIPEPLVGVRS